MMKQLRDSTKIIMILTSISFVGLMVFYTDPDPETGDIFSHRCSGTLISPTLMVTAGHCTEGVESGRVYFQQAAAPNYDPDAFGGLPRQPAHRASSGRAWPRSSPADPGGRRPS